MDFSNLLSEGDIIRITNGTKDKIWEIDEISNQAITYLKLGKNETKTISHDQFTEEINESTAFKIRYD